MCYFPWDRGFHLVQHGIGPSRIDCDKHSTTLVDTNVARREIWAIPYASFHPFCSLSIFALLSPSQPFPLSNLRAFLFWQKFTLCLRVQHSRCCLLASPLRSLPFFRLISYANSQCIWARDRERGKIKLAQSVSNLSLYLEVYPANLQDKENSGGQLVKQLLLRARQK